MSGFDTRAAWVLGIDPGKTVGWCLYNPSFDTLVGSLPLRGDLGEMLAEFSYWLSGQHGKYAPALVAVERPFGRAAFTNDLPAQVLGVVHMIAHECETPRREFTASALKKAITGNGRATKRDMIEAIRTRYGIQVASDHEADAAAVAIVAWNREAQAGAA